MLSDMFNYIIKPARESDIRVLRNAFICGIIAFVLFVVGLKYLLVLIMYLFITTTIVVVTWLYTLPQEARNEIISRIKDVFCTFMRTCIEEVVQDDKKKKNVVANGETGDNSNVLVKGEDLIEKDEDSTDYLKFNYVDSYLKELDSSKS